MWNVTLTADPIFGEGFLSFPLDGTVILGKQSVVEEKELPNLPLYVSDGETNESVQVQVFISENALESSLRSLHELNKLHMKNKIQSTFLKTLFPNFEEVFG